MLTRKIWIKYAKVFFISALFITIFHNSYGQKSKDKKSLTKPIGYTNITSLITDWGYKPRKLKIEDNEVYQLDIPSGPITATIIPKKVATSFLKYDKGGTNRLCVFLTDTSSSWLGIVDGLAAQGVPFRVTNKVEEALKHKVVIVYPGLASNTLNYNTLEKLRDHPSNGGVLIAFNVLAPSIYKVFGFKANKFSTQRDTITFRQLDIPETSFIQDVNEGRLRIGNMNMTPANTTTIGYLETAFKPIAVFEDGSGAIVRNIFNNGATYAFGIDLGFLTLFAHANLDPQIQRTYVNNFEPTLDVLFRMIRSIYWEYADFPIIKGSVPENKMVPVLLTHDIDYSFSVDTMLLFASLEAANNIQATYFVQTKYIKDKMDIPFITHDKLQNYHALLSMGMEIGSHSVSHTPFFSFLPLGSGYENYPDYRPYYYNFTSTFNETVLGELRVSHYLIEQLFGEKATSFRSGYLGFPEKLHVGMKEVGFKYGSNITANEVLTHMPYNTMYDYMLDSELDLYEFPITIEDDEPPEMDKRFEEAVILTKKVSRYGGIINILIHPNIMGHKYRFLEMYIEKFKEEAWFGTVSQYGEWWAARTKLEVDAKSIDNYVIVTLAGPLKIKNLPLVIPKYLKYISADCDVGNVKKTESGYLIEKINRRTQLIFEDQNASLNK